MEELPDTATTSASATRLQYSVVLPDSRNPSLRSRFEPRHDYKPSSPDEDLTEMDESENKTILPRRGTNYMSGPLGGRSPQTSPIRYVVLDPRSGKKALFARKPESISLSPIDERKDSVIGWGSQSSQNKTGVIDLSEEEVPVNPRLVVEPLPTRIPYERVTHYVCNDYRERTPEFRRKLKEFQVYLAQHDHVSKGNWNRSEPFSERHKEILQRCVHPDGVHFTVSTMMNLDKQFPGHGIPWGIVRDYQYACEICRVRRWFAPLTRHRHTDCPFVQSPLLATVNTLADWSGVQCPPEPIDDDEAVCNWGHTYESGRSVMLIAGCTGSANSLSQTTLLVMV